MVPFVKRIRELHPAVKTPEDYLLRHRKKLAERHALGERYGVHDSPIVLHARVDGNEWIVQCECGAGNAIDPSWDPVFACCFGCGAIHRSILLPKRWDAIEQELLKRPQPSTRFWFPHETVDDLIAENIAHGVQEVR